MQSRDTNQPTFWAFLRENMWGVTFIGIGVVLIVLGVVIPELGNLLVLLFSLFDNASSQYAGSNYDAANPWPPIVLGLIFVAIGVAGLAFAWRLSRA